MECYSAISNNMDDLEIIILSEVSQRKANVSAYRWNLKNDTNELIYIYGI